MSKYVYAILLDILDSRSPIEIVQLSITSITTLE